MDFKYVRKGYEPEQVDNFVNYLRENWGSGNVARLEKEIRTKRFDTVKGGYSIHEVNKALHVMEQHSAKRHKYNSVSLVGNQLYTEQVQKQLTSLWSAKKSLKENFAHGQDKEKSYSVRQVDKYISKLKKSFNSSQIKLTNHQLKNKTFNTVKGKKGYKMQEVDEFLDKIIAIYNALTV